MTTIFRITKGGKPVSQAQIEAAKQRYMNAQGWPEHWRSEAINTAILSSPEHPLYQKAMAALMDFRSKVIETQKINAFNRQLAAYKPAAQRLTRYRLADGRPEVYEDQPTGETDTETGEPITESVRVQTAIEPLPAEVEQPVYSDEGEQTGTEMVPNPAIERDDAERAAAQAVVDQTPQDVKDFT